MTRAAASMVIALGVVLVFYGLSKAVTGTGLQHLPAQIESITPVRSATQVQEQERVQVDLIAGYTGVLIIDNVELPTYDQSNPAVAAQPGQQVTLPPETIFERGNYTLTFTPQKGALVDKYNTGVNTVTVRYWKITDGPAFFKTFTWQFDVV